MAKSRKSGRTPGGVTLAQLAQGFKNQGLEIPEHIKQLMNEQDQKPATPSKKTIDKWESSRKAKEEAKTNEAVDKPVKEQSQTPPVEKKEEVQAPKEETKPQEPSKPDAGFARSFIKNLIGKNLADKLIKRSASEAHQEVRREVSNTKDLKAIRLEMEEIREALLKQGKKSTIKLPQRKPSAAKKFTSSFTNAFKRTATQPFDKLGYKFVRPKALKMDKPKKEETKKTADKVPSVIAPAMAAQLQAKLAPQKNVDQEKVEQVKTETTKESQMKAMNAKLDKILEELDHIKRKGSGGSMLGMIAAGLAGLMGIIKPMWNAVRKLVTDIAKIGSWIAKKLGTAWSAVKEVGSTVGRVVKNAVKKGWEVAKKVAKKGGEVIEEGAAAVGVGSKALRVGGKALGAAGAALDVGSGLYDLSQGERQTELHGLDYISPMRLGMRAGEAINQGVSKLTGGEDLSEMISRIPEKVSDALKPSATKPQPVPKKLPEKVATVSAQNTEMKQTQKSEPQIVLIKGGNKTTVIPQKQTGAVAVSLSTRNPERSISRLNSILFDDPAGYGNTSRL